MDIKVINNKFSHFICKIWFNVTAIAFTPFRIILLSQVWNDAAKWQQDATVNHELVHMYQAKRDGIIKMTFKYIFSRKWRIQYEAEAYCENIKALMTQGYTLNRSVEMYANLLANISYLKADKTEADYLLREFMSKEPQL